MEPIDISAQLARLSSMEEGPAIYRANPKAPPRGPGYVWFNWGMLWKGATDRSGWTDRSEELSSWGWNAFDVKRGYQLTHYCWGDKRPTQPPPEHELVPQTFSDSP